MAEFQAMLMGGPVQADIPAMPGKTATAQKAEKGKQKQWLIAGALVVVGIAAATVFNNSQQQAEAVQRQKLEFEAATARQAAVEAQRRLEEAEVEAKQKREAEQAARLNVPKPEVRDIELRIPREAEQAARANVPAMVAIPGKNIEIGKYEVTRGQFAEFVRASGYDAGNQCVIFEDLKEGPKADERSGSHWRNPGFVQDDNHPVTCVNWYDTQAYITWLNQQTGKQYRLPSGAEWEYTCYGGRKTEYCGGDDIDAVAWYLENSSSKTHPAGRKRANSYGLYDMSGNVSEWTQDCWQGDCANRVLRGGPPQRRPAQLPKQRRRVSPRQDASVA